MKKKKKEPRNFDKDFLANELSTLPKTHRLAFAASCAERLFPNYAAFSQKTNWGDTKVLREALDEVWGILSGKVVEKERIAKLMALCDQVTPDTEDFDSIDASLALDATNAVYTMLMCVTDCTVQKAVEVASYARDTVDMSVQELENMDYNDPHFEKKILQHPLMAKELKKQRGDLFVLKKVASLSWDIIQKLRNSSVEGLCSV
jgi:uncharacterized protein